MNALSSDLENRCSSLIENLGLGAAADVKSVVPLTGGVASDIVAVNLDGIFHTYRAIVPYMEKNDYGRIVNISSMAGKDGNPNASAYSVSKAAVINLTKCLGKELAQGNIRVNAIVPAVIETEMLADVTEEQIGYMLAKIPMGRMGSVDEIAAMIA